MLYLICTSLLGLIIISRILSLIEKSQLFSRHIFVIIAVFLTLPVIFFSFFKEPNIFNTIYIGIILGILINLNVFFKKKIKYSYEKCHLRILDMIIFNFNAGFSPSKCIEIAIDQLKSDEKTIFSHFLSHFENKFITKSGSHIEIEKFSTEIKYIISSRVKILQQLKEFKRNSKIVSDLRHKSRQATQQARAQAAVSSIIYMLLVMISVQEFELFNHPYLILTSMFLFLSGIFLIIKIGQKIKWTV